MERRQIAKALMADAPRIVKEWREQARAHALVPPDPRLAIPLLEDLGRMLDREGTRAALIFAARVRAWGRARHDARIALLDAAREILTLEELLIRRPEVTISEAREICVVLGEGLAAVVDEHARASLEQQASFKAGPAIEALLADLEEAVVVVDRAGVPLLKSRRAKELFPVAEQAQLTDLKELRQLAAALTGEVIRGRIQHRDPLTGQEQTFSSHARPIFEPRLSSDGDDPRTVQGIGGAIVVLGDVSEVVRQAEALTRLEVEHASLETRLLRRGRARALAELAAGTALQLNNELNAIALTLRLLAPELRGTAAARHLVALEGSTHRSAVLTAHLQQLATPSPTETVRPVDLNALVLEALDVVRPEITAAANEKSLRVDARFERLGRVAAHPAELRELLCTLLIGIRDALPDGGVVRVETAARAGGAELVISHPTSAETAEVSSDRTLFLASADSSVRRGGGRLEIVTAAEQVRYQFTFPPGPDLTRPGPPHPGEAGPRRVLIVDDDAGNRESLSEFLTLEGHAADAVASWPEALALVEARPPSVALVDLAMPDVNGWELARRLRALNPELRIALVTGWEIGEPDLAAHGGVVDSILHKPLDLAELRRFLRSGREIGPPR